jgi:hypothetical protein
MGTSRKIVNRLQRMTGTEPTTPPEAGATSKEDRREGPRHAVLRPEELITLRNIVLKTQLEPFQPTPSSAAPAPPAPETVRKDYTVTNIETILKEAMQIDGAIGVALVDYTSGMTLGQAGGANLNLDVAAAGNTEVVRAKLRTMEALGLRDGIEDIPITLTTQYHLIRLISSQTGAGLFLYLALDKGKSNLALARHKLSTLEVQIEI